ncbi:MAG: hypothetical protein FOGNACKC_03486 [Anaerolineae bacterium]|nr:hypothetical protein [Anaerolineae bacterium]
MKVRRTKYIYTEVVEERRIPLKRRPTILPVPVRPLNPRPSQYNLLPPQPAPTRPSKQLLSLAFKSLPLATLGLLAILMMAGIACALASLFALSTPDKNVVVMRRPAMMARHLPTFTPTPAKVQDTVALPAPAVDDAVLPSYSLAATPVPPPTVASIDALPPSVANSQNSSRPTLTSLVALNVRSGPGLEYSVVGKLAAGQSTGITGQNPDGSWWQIEYPLDSGQQGWVSADPQYSTVSQAMPQMLAQASPTSQPVAALTTTAALSPGASSTSSGWTFNGVTQLAGISEEGLLLMGELVNGTGAPQQVLDISGAFYDAQGQVAADSLNMVSYVPVDPIPVGAHVPFELQVSGDQNIDRFDLNAISTPASDPPRQDFKFSNVEQWVDEATGYCIRGQVDNLGPPLREYLIVLAIGYDDKGSVVNFGEYYVDTLPTSGAQSSPFELCLASLGRQLSRHDLRAFGY